MKISHLPTPVLPDLRTTRPDGQAPQGANRSGVAPTRPAPQRPAAAPAASAAERGTLSGARLRQHDPQPPEGTDPKLWSILTSEERSFFARAGAQGPLTYARVMMGTHDQSLAPSMRGLRLDIRG